MKETELIPHLFRTEYSKIVAVLCKTFGLYNIEIAEDIVSDTFLKATETWGLKGIPENPTAWLYSVAKNRFKDYYKRKQVFDNKISPELQQASVVAEVPELDLTETNIRDSQLKMIFFICHPSITSESQVALALRVLCGFSIEEVANALLTNKTNINKRLVRAKEKLRNIDFEINDLDQSELSGKLNSVLSILYLLFNEGYFSTHATKKIRKDLCFEAMRLLHLLTSNEKTNLPTVNALLALFCFQSSRFEARTNSLGEQILLEDQQPSQWNKPLIEKGEYYLIRSFSNKKISRYHLEAMIAFWHTKEKMDVQKKWDNILQLYNRLLQVKYSPMAALNRTYALARVEGNEIALKEALKIKLKKNHLYHALLAELYKGIDQPKQIEHLQIAIQLAKSSKDKLMLENKLKAIGDK